MIGGLLITGGNLPEREKKARDLLEKLEKNWSFENNPDFFLVTSEGLSIAIEDIRQLQKELSLKPYSHQIKAAFIPRAENLTVEAQNALLKTLEEPPEKTAIILSAPDSGWLLPTVVSRCQIVQLSLKPQIIMPEKEEKELVALWSKFNTVGVGERWQILEKLNLFQDRQKAIEWIDKIIFITRKLMVDGIDSSKAPDYSNTQLLNNLKSLNLTKSRLEANTNIRLTLENLFLDL